MEEMRNIPQYLLEHVKRQGVNPFNMSVLTNTFKANGFNGLQEQDIKDYLGLVNEYITKFRSEGELWDE